MTRGRDAGRPRYGRIAVLGAALSVTLLTGLAGTGVLGAGTAAVAGPVVRQASYQQNQPPGPATGPATGPASGPATGSVTRPATPSGVPAGTARLGPTTSGGHMDAPAQVPVPASSGSGRRIVFSQHLQRVWLVGARDDKVRRTYLVSGSVTDNLQPGSYSVYSRSRHAVGVDDSGAMQYFVRFTRGPTGAAIGFHSIPIKNGVPLQTTAELGTAQSHGCIRQWKPDALALWHFAPVGTRVVVVA